MSLNFLQICNPIKPNRIKTALFIAIFAFLITFLSEYFFTHSLIPNLMLGLGTAFSAFITVFTYHYLLFQKLTSNKLKYTLLIAFPFIYMLVLIAAFGTVTMLIDLTLYQVPFINQIYLQMWAFLGKAYIYAAFSPKTPFALTCILVMLGFYAALKQTNTQQHQQTA